MAADPYIETVQLTKRAGRMASVIKTEGFETLFRPHWSVGTLPPYVRAMCLRLSAHYSMDPLVFVGPMLVGFAGLLGPHTHVEDGLGHEVRPSARMASCVMSCVPRAEQAQRLHCQRNAVRDGEIHKHEGCSREFHPCGQPRQAFNTGLHRVVQRGHHPGNEGGHHCQPGYTCLGRR